MSWAVVQTAPAGSTSGNTVSATFTTANVQAGNKIIAVVSVGATSAPAVTSVKDGALNTWTQVGNANQANARSYIFALDVPAGDAGTKPTLTATSSSTPGLSIEILEVSGLLAGNTTAMCDGTAGTLTGTASSTGSPTYSSTASNEFLISSYGDFGAGNTVGTSAGWTAGASNVNGSTDSNCLLQYKNSTNGSESDGFTSADTNGWAVVMVAFKLGVLGVSTTSLPAAATGAAYSQTLAASGGTAPYTWAVSGGVLPSWASLNASTGAITGTPSAGQGGSVFTVQVTDNVGATAVQLLTLNVRAPVTLVGAVGVASGTSSPLTAVFGQSPTAGNLLLAVVSAGSTTAETANISTAAGGWSRLTSGSVGNNAAGTSLAIVDAWVKTAVGGDTAPTFTQTLSGSPQLTCFMYELNGANVTTPLDVQAVQQTGSATTTVTFSITTAALGGYGEFAVSVMAQERASATLTWTETGSGWTSQGKLPAAGASVLFTQSNSQASAGPAALTDAGHWSTQTTARGAALIVTIQGAAVPATQRGLVVSQAVRRAAYY